MVEWDWFVSDDTQVLSIVLKTVGIYIALMLYTRLGGLRSFSKLSSFDFAITVSFGSIIAATVLAKSPQLLTAAIALGSLYLIQYLVSKTRRHSQWFSRLVDNEPILVMAGSQVLGENLDKVRMTETDLAYKLRLAGITNKDQVFAVVFETTGDVSVCKHSDEPDLSLFDGVIGQQQLRDLVATKTA